MFGSRVKFCSKSQKQASFIKFRWLAFKEVKFDKFKFIADQIMLVSGGRLYAVVTTKPRCT